MTCKALLFLGFAPWAWQMHRRKVRWQGKSSVCENTDGWETPVKRWVCADHTSLPVSQPRLSPGCPGVPCPGFQWERKRTRYLKGKEATAAAAIEGLEEFLADTKSSFNFEVHFHLVSQSLCEVYGETIPTMCLIWSFQISFHFLLQIMANYFFWGIFRAYIPRSGIIWSYFIAFVVYFHTGFQKCVVN